ncbi:MAG: pirin family protein [Deltaproteobacteria bacterium]|nr:pirin family protein [Deltaproteobacteria bacterium]
MGETRRIKKVYRSRPTIEGAGVHLKRALGQSEAPQFDPFLLLDDFHGTDPALYEAGFPWHPHRGIETITYVLTGEVAHGDSLGNSGVIQPGDVQWMTAGQGIVHQEMPHGDQRGVLWGLQLWANLPASHKMMPPRYRGLTAAEIPAVEAPGGAQVKVIAGEIAGVAGAVRDIVTLPQYLDVSLPAGAEFRHAIPRGHTVLAYVLEGRGYFCEDQDRFAHESVDAQWYDLTREPYLGPETLIWYTDGDEVKVTTQDLPARFLLISGQPLGEPVAWWGPIVMNTQEELRAAFEQYQNGTFLSGGK